MFPRVTHPSATPRYRGVRLACVKPAASVRSEPGSNSQVVVNSKTQTRLITVADQASARSSRRVPNTSAPAQPESQPKRDESGNVTVGAVLSPHLKCSARPKPGRKDPAVHVSLSSDMIVKQRRTARKPPRKRPAPRIRTGPGKTTRHPANPAGRCTPEINPEAVETRSALKSSAAVDDPDIRAHTKDVNAEVHKTAKMRGASPQTRPAPQQARQTRGNHGTTLPRPASALQGRRPRRRRSTATPSGHDPRWRWLDRTASKCGDRSPHPTPPRQGPIPSTEKGEADRRCREISRRRGRSRRRPAWCAGGRRAGGGGSGGGRPRRC